MTFEMPSPLSQSRTWDLVAPGYAAGSVEHFELYAKDALALANLSADQRALDVATGPGSLALLASKMARSVDAIDFSPEMLRALENRLASTSITNVTATLGDGQSLPFDDETFDAAFSMFGLMFFPDRAAGFAELARVLKPRCVAVVSSWEPMENVPALTAVFDGLYAALPDLPRETPDLPLGTEESIVAEMSTAGFAVIVHEISHQLLAASAREFWAGVRQSFAPIVLLEDELGREAFEPVAAAIESHVVSTLGDGPVTITMPALFGVGRRT